MRVHRAILTGGSSTTALVCMAKQIGRTVILIGQEVICKLSAVVLDPPLVLASEKPFLRNKNETIDIGQETSGGRFMIHGRIKTTSGALSRNI